MLVVGSDRSCGATPALAVLGAGAAATPTLGFTDVAAKLKAGEGVVAVPRSGVGAVSAGGVSATGGTGAPPPGLTTIWSGVAWSKVMSKPLLGCGGAGAPGIAGGLGSAAPPPAPGTSRTLTLPSTTSDARSNATVVASPLRVPWTAASHLPSGRELHAPALAGVQSFEMGQASTTATPALAAST